MLNLQISPDKNKKQYHIASLVFLIFWTFILYTRESGFGCDNGSYWNIFLNAKGLFEHIKNMSPSNITYVFFSDFLFFYLNSFISDFLNTSQMHDFWMFWPRLISNIAIWRLCKGRWIPILLIILNPINYYNNHTLRSFCGLSIYLLGMTCDKKKMSLFLKIIGCFFHSSIWMLLIIDYVSQYLQKFNNKKIIIYSFIMYGAIGCLLYLNVLVFEDIGRSSTYSHQSYMPIHGFIFYSYLTILLTIFFKKEYTFIFSVMLFCNFAIFGLSLFTSRFFSFLYPCLVQATYKEKNKLYFFFLIWVGIYHAYSYYITVNNIHLPYSYMYVDLWNTVCSLFT